MPPFNKCPICRNYVVFTRKKSGLFSSNEIYFCEGCKSIWKKFGDDKYKLISTSYNTINKYKTLTSNEWKKIGLLGDDFIEESAYCKKISRKWLIDNLSKGYIPIEYNTTIFLKQNEYQYISSESTLYESKIVSRRTGTSSGYSIPIGSGIRYRTSTFNSSSSYSHLEMKKITDGRIILTNKRIIFSGLGKNLNIELNKIISIDAEEDKITIYRENKQIPETFKNIDGEIWAHTIHGSMVNLKEGLPYRVIEFSVYIEEKENGMVQIQCPICQAKYKIKLELITNNKYKCPYCDIDFSSMSLLKA